MPQRNCQHVLTNGALCNAPPLRNRSYCHFHLDLIGRRMRAARARARRQVVPMKMPLFEDLHALQVGLMQLGDAIQHNEIDVQRGRLLLSVLRLAASNLKCKQSWAMPAHPNTDRETYVSTSYDSFEQTYDLPEDLDLSADPEQLFPPPEIEPEDENGSGAAANPWDGLIGNEKLAELLRDAETPVPGSPQHITADDVEILDIMNREGGDAAARRAGELARNRARAERRLQRAHYEELARNRNIQLAAYKLIDDQKRAEAAEQLQAQAAGDKAQHPDRTTLEGTQSGSVQQESAAAPATNQPTDRGATASITEQKIARKPPQVTSAADDSKPAKTSA